MMLEQSQPHLRQLNRQLIALRFLLKRVSHLHYMARLTTMTSIACVGILSYRKRQLLSTDARLQQSFRQLGMDSIADPFVQFRRDHRQAFGRNLHEYVPLYIGIFTPMQYVVTRDNFADQAGTIVFAEVDVMKVFDIEGICYADGNAASASTTFYNDTSGIDEIAWSIVLHENRCWSDDYKRWKCAEVLVPDRVPPECIARYIFMEHARADEFCALVDVLIKEGHITYTDFEVVVDPDYFYSMRGGKLQPNG